MRLRLPYSLPEGHSNNNLIMCIADIYEGARTLVGTHSFFRKSSFINELKVLKITSLIASIGFLRPIYSLSVILSIELKQLLYCPIELTKGVDG